MMQTKNVPHGETSQHLKRRHGHGLGPHGQGVVVVAGNDDVEESHGRCHREQIDGKVEEGGGSVDVPRFPGEHFHHRPGPGRVLRRWWRQVEIVLVEFGLLLPQIGGSWDGQDGAPNCRRRS